MSRAATDKACGRDRRAASSRGDIYLSNQPLHQAAQWPSMKTDQNPRPNKKPKNSHRPRNCHILFGRQAGKPGHRMLLDVVGQVDRQEYSNEDDAQNSTAHEHVSRPPWITDAVSHRARIGRQLHIVESHSNGSPPILGAKRKSVPTLLGDAIAISGWRSGK